MPLDKQTILVELNNSIEKINAHIQYEQEKQNKEPQAFRETRIQSLVKLRNELKGNYDQLAAIESEKYNPMLMGSMRDNIKEIKTLAEQTKNSDLTERKSRVKAATYLGQLKRDRVEMGGKTAKCLDGVITMSTKLIDGINNDLKALESSTNKDRERRLGLDSK